MENRWFIIFYYLKPLVIIRTTERNADVLLIACKDIGLAVNTGKTKYMEIGSPPVMIANELIRMGSNDKVKTLKYLFSLLTDQHSIEGEIKCILKVGNVVRMEDGRSAFKI